MTHPRSAARVLVVAEAGPRSVVERVLVAGGHSVEHAPDASDVALVDLATARDELLEALHARGIPVVALGAAAELERSAAARAEVAAVLTPPPEPGALLVAVERAVEMKRLKERAQLDRDLLSTLAHDVRSSLASVVMVAPSLVGQGTPAQERKVMLLQRGVRRVERLLEDLLDIADLDVSTGDLPLSSERASDLLEDVVAALAEPAADKGVEVAAKLGGDFVLRCDRRRLTSALRHLGAQAIRLTPTGGVVTIHAERGDDRARLSVEDGRRPSAGDTTRRASDLGLALARAIASAHGGTVRVSEAEGGGTRRELELPLDGPTGEQRTVAGQEVTAASS